MKKIVLLLSLITFLSSAHAEFICKGPAGTVIESFKVSDFGKDSFDASLDGRFQGISESSDKRYYEISFNNGCDNDVEIMIPKAVVELKDYEYLSEFSLKMNYMSSDSYLLDVSVICFNEKYIK